MVLAVELSLVDLALDDVLQLQASFVALLAADGAEVNRMSALHFQTHTWASNEVITYQWWFMSKLILVGSSLFLFLGYYGHHLGRSRDQKQRCLCKLWSIMCFPREVVMEGMNAYR